MLIPKGRIVVWSFCTQVLAFKSNISTLKAPISTNMVSMFKFTIREQFGISPLTNLHAFWDNPVLFQYIVELLVPVEDMARKYGSFSGGEFREVRDLIAILHDLWVPLFGAKVAHFR